MRPIQWLRLSLSAVFLLLTTGCGGGSGGGGGTTTQPPSALSYSTVTASYTKGTAIAANSPTSSGGAVASYSVSPALPAGLSLSSSAGVIGGTPTAVTATTTYTVTASNSGGSTTEALSITVNDQSPSALAYTTSPADYTQAVAIAPNTPTSTGGAVTSYSVSPALPAGLSLSTGTGVISGTPTAVTAQTSYTVTASNSGGSTTATLTIAVKVVVPPLSADNVNLIFAVSEDLAYHAAGDINRSTANLTNQGLQRSLLLAPFLQQDVLGTNNVTSIYALEPMTHLQTTFRGSLPDLVALETVQQFAMLNQITLSVGSNPPFTAYGYPIFSAYSSESVPAGVATPVFPCPACQGLDFIDQNGDNEALVSGIVNANVPGFYVFSAPWETTLSLLANINNLEGYKLTLPSSYQGPNTIYAIAITPSGTASLVTYNSNLNPPSSYPVLPSPGVVSTPCTAQTPFRIALTGGSGSAVIPAGANTNETVYMIRHAEAHPTTYWDVGNYVGAGQWRALGLPNSLRGKIHPTQVYSVDPAIGIPVGVGSTASSYVRPSMTAEPYAIANNLPYYLAASVAVFAQNAPQLSTVASDYFFSGGKFSNQTLLVAWEHDHIPTTVNALLATYHSGQTAPNWPDDDYDTVWTVKLDANSNLTVDNAICEGIDSAKLPAMAPQF